MSTLTITAEPLATAVEISDTMLTVVLDDGRELSVPMAWFPRLRDADPRGRAHWRLIGRGEGIHWPDIDEDISVISLLAGRTRRPHAA